MGKTEEKTLQVLSRVAVRHEMIVLIIHVEKETCRMKIDFISENVDAYGYTTDEFLEGRITWEDLIYEEDRKSAMKELQSQMINGGTRFQQDYRVCKKNGSVVWLHADNVITRDLARHVSKIEMLVTNIDDLKAQELRLLKQQHMYQEEMRRYKALQEETGNRERLTEFIREIKIDLLQNAFSEIFRVHTAIVGLDYHFYTPMTGPREEEGIFYDIAELRKFRKKFTELNNSCAEGERNRILDITNPNIKISGVPIHYSGEHIATWLICVLEERDEQEVLKILQFMRIMAHTMSDYYNNYMGHLAEKTVTRELYRQKNILNGKEVLIQLYELSMEAAPGEDVLEKLFEKIGVFAQINRIVVYEEIPDTLYIRRKREWKDAFGAQKGVADSYHTVRALPNPADIMEDGIAVMNSIHLKKEYRDTFADLCCKAAVLISINLKGGKQGFLAFLETEGDRVFYDDTIEFLIETKKIIEKVLLK